MRRFSQQIGYILQLKDSYHNFVETKEKQYITKYWVVIVTVFYTGKFEIKFELKSGNYSEPLTDPE